ncbi:MAG TPA: hypothetical protein V6C72_15725, partial [Chroococcales cyanobacterium]
DKLTAQLDATQCDLNAITLEGKIMRHIRNQALHEFIMFSVRSREQEWTENSFFAFNAIQHGCAVAANITAIKAFSNRTYTPGAAIANIVASSIGVVNPLSRPFIGQAISRYWHWRLTKLLPEDRPTPRRIQDLIKEWKEFEQLGTTDVHKIIHEIANNADIDSSELREVAELVRNTARQDNYLLRDDAELRKLRRVAAEQAITGPATNLASLARQVCTEVAYSGYRHEPVINNRINIAGRISQISGQTWQLIATPAAVVRRVQFERKLKETNQLPSQVLTKRLKQLADLEQEARELSF